MHWMSDCDCEEVVPYSIVSKRSCSINNTASLSPSNNIIFGLCILTHFFNLNYCFEITTTTYLLWIIGNFLTTLGGTGKSVDTLSALKICDQGFSLPVSILHYEDIQSRLCCVSINFVFNSSADNFVFVILPNHFI